MAKCDGCGNEYDKSFQVMALGKPILLIASNARSTHLRAHLCALRYTHRRAWLGERRPDVLL